MVSELQWSKFTSGEKRLLGLAGVVLGMVVLLQFVGLNFPFGHAFSDDPRVDDPPVGFLEEIYGNTGLVTGWALDEDLPSRSIMVHFYLDGPAGSGGQFIGFTTANIFRPDVNNALGVTGNHGFNFIIPNQYRDGNSHLIYVYGIDTGSNDYNAELSDSPQENVLASSGAIFPDTGPSVQVVGSPAVVFNHSTQACADLDIPDMPARAFRDQNGLVNFIDSHYITWRSTGDSLDNLQRDCKVTMRSANNPDFNKFTFNEWLTTPYRADDGKIYALVHNEWYAYLVDPKCTQAEQINGWVNALTLAVSDDNGASFHHPADYVVWRPVVPWNTSFSCSAPNYTRYGAMNPSSIVKKDGYYYVLYQSEADPTGHYHSGTCLMRTARLDQAKAWQVWNGANWDDSVDAVCQPLDPDKIEKMHESLTYSKYFNAYLLVGTKMFPEAGIFFSLSSDLIHWSKPIKIYPATGMLYSSFIDESDTSPNFEYSGREGYVYFTRPNNGNGGLNRDLMRLKIRFSGSSHNAPLPTPTPTPTITPQPTATPIPTATITPTGTATPTVLPTLTPTATPTPIFTPEPTPTPNFTPNPTPTPRPCNWWLFFFGMEQTGCQRR